MGTLIGTIVLLIILLIGYISSRPQPVEQEQNYNDAKVSIYLKGDSVKNIESFTYNITDSKTLAYVDTSDTIFNASFIQSEDGVHISNKHYQIFMPYEDGAMMVNSNKFDYDGYKKPSIDGTGRAYYDFNAAMSALGYNTVLSFNIDNTKVDINIEKKDKNDNLAILELVKPNMTPEKESEHFVEEEFAQKQQDETNVKTPTIPKPDREYETEIKETRPVVKGNEDDFYVEYEDALQDPGGEVILPDNIDRSNPDYENIEEERNFIYTEDEYDEMQDKLVEDAKEIFEEFKSPSNEETVKEDGNMTIYNRFPGSPSIIILKDPSIPYSGTEFVEATIKGDWSDYAWNMNNTEAVAYYEQYPDLVRATLKLLLGENEGERVFQIVKEDADETDVHEGYAVIEDENGDITRPFEERDFGDGMVLDEYPGGYTDYGLKYQTFMDRPGLNYGMRIIVYK